MARASRSKASIPVRFKGYKVTANPAADTEPDESANKADKRPLTTAELKLYWRAIKAAPGFRGAVLRLHLLTGGQRIQQLVTLRTDILHGIAQRAADGTAAVADAVETGRKAVPLAELAWDCTLRHQAATR